MGRDKPSSAMGTRTSDFNPLSPHGERPFNQFFVPDHDGNFNPLSPHGERLSGGGIGKILQKFQSTLPAWGETPAPVVTADDENISIHSPRMGRDRTARVMFFPLSISIHSPRMGRDPAPLRDWPRRYPFQSTLPAWGETSDERPRYGIYDNFNPLSPHGERRWRSIASVQTGRFQSTLPAWGETKVEAARYGQGGISIHSPRMGRDAPPHLHRPPKNPFQSTLPAWGETWTISFLALSAVFQSTLPAWGETKLCNRYNVCRKISIHSPRMGRDGVDQLQLAVLHYFNPLSPHGERRQLP